MRLKRFFPFFDLKNYQRADVPQDMVAALAVTFMAIPQGVAYAMIAGLPPVMGLYASAMPTIVGSMMRSSRHVIAGPSNAISLLVGGGVIAMSGLDPVSMAVTLALMVGVFQLAAGYLRLGAVVDYISNPVILGYITGAALLIGVGQLSNLTGTAKGSGNIFEKIMGWLEGVGAFSPITLGVALASAVLIAVLRKTAPRLPGASITLGLATVVTYLGDLRVHGLTVVADLTSVPSGFPPLTLPDLSLFAQLAPLAVACAVLSLVESSALARAIGAQSGQPIDISAEFTGQGWSNIAAGFFGGYPTSGSLARSAVNHRTGAKSRMAGVYAGSMTIIVLLFLGPAVDYTPIASLAGLLMVVAAGLIEPSRIKVTMQGPWSDRIAFMVTLFGTWVMPLDQAIYLGVGISIVLFLRQARLLVVHELGVDKDRRLRDLVDDDDGSCTTCNAIRILHIEGHLFFGAAGELQGALDNAIRDERIRVLVLRLKRTRGMDVTVATTLEAAAVRMHDQGRHVILAGVRPEIIEVLQRTRIVDVIGEASIFPTEARWFKSLKDAIGHAQTLIGEDKTCAECPLSFETSEAFDLVPRPRHLVEEE